LFLFAKPFFHLSPKHGDIILEVLDIKSYEVAKTLTCGNKSLEMVDYINVGSLENKSERTVSIHGDCCANIPVEDLKKLQQEIILAANTMVHLKVWDGVYKDPSKPRAPAMIFAEVQTIEGANRILERTAFAWENKSVRVGGRSRSQTNWGASAYFDAHASKSAGASSSGHSQGDGRAVQRGGSHGGATSHGDSVVVAQMGARMNTVEADVSKLKRGLKRVEVNQNKTSLEVSYIAKHITTALKLKKKNVEVDEVGEDVEGVIDLDGVDEDVEEGDDEDDQMDEKPRKKAKSDK
jgi:hypothetical protein